MSTASSSVALIAATLQLKLVESVLRAIQAPNPLKPGGFGSIGRPGECCDRFCPGSVVPEPRYLPRHVIVPTPRYLPRHVIQPMPRADVECLPRGECKGPNITPGPQPPWKVLPGKVLPGQELAPAVNVIKIIIRQPDMVGKGNLIDLFV